VAAEVLRPVGPAATARSPPRVTSSPVKPAMPRSLVMTSTRAVEEMPIWSPQETPPMSMKLGPYHRFLAGSRRSRMPSPYFPPKTNPAFTTEGKMATPLASLSNFPMYRASS